ncbi:hypothetical protein ABPG77_010773 [Micractinium sp. CCAP 211/92]
MATLTLSFEAILAGECGPTEAQAAQRWLDAGAPLYEPPSGMVYSEEGRDGLDMTTIHRVPGGQHRRRTSGHSHGFAPPASSSKRQTVAGSSQPMPVQRRQQPLSAVAGPAAAQAKPSAMQQHHPGRQTASLQRGPAAGAAAQRAARSPAEAAAPSLTAKPPTGFPEIPTPAAQSPADLGLGPGWQVRPVGGTKGAAAAAAARISSPQAKKQQGKGQAKRASQQRRQPGSKGAAGAEQAQQVQQQYISPEGLAFPSLQAAREVVHHGPILPPRKLVRYVRAAAADPLTAAAAADSTRGLAHQLGIRRVRIVRIEEERQRLKRRLAQASSPAVPPSDRQLRRRS